MLAKVAIAIACGLLTVYCGNLLFIASAQTPSLTLEQRQQQGQLDAVVRAQEPMPIQTKRPEQQKTAHDRSDVFDESHAMPTLLSGHQKRAPPVRVPPVHRHR